MKVPYAEVHAAVTRDSNNVTTVVPHQPGITPAAITLPAPPA